MLNALTVNDISRTKFVSIVGSYKKGTHLVYTDIMNDRDAKEIDIEFDSPVNISVDGEVVKVSRLSLSSEHNAIRFLVPKGCEYKKSADIKIAAEV
jgi:diacylglycerol kinase family enzyme